MPTCRCRPLKEELHLSVLAIAVNQYDGVPLKLYLKALLSNLIFPLPPSSINESICWFLGCLGEELQSDKLKPWGARLYKAVKPCLMGMGFLIRVLENCVFIAEK